MEKFDFILICIPTSDLLWRPPDPCYRAWSVYQLPNKHPAVTKNKDVQRVAEEEEEEEKEADLHVFVLDGLTSADAIADVKMDEFRGKLHGRGQPVDDLHRMKTHLHVNENREELCDVRGVHQSEQNLDCDQGIVLHQVGELLRRKA